MTTTRRCGYDTTRPVSGQIGAETDETVLSIDIHCYERQYDGGSEESRFVTVTSPFNGILTHTSVAISLNPEPNLRTWAEVGLQRR